MTDLDMNAFYKVEGWEGIAFTLRGYSIEIPVGEYWDEEMGEVCWMDEPLYSASQVIAVMVGDNRRHTVDVGELTLISEDEFCQGCGQIGCGH